MHSSWKSTLLGYAQRQPLRGLALVAFLLVMTVLLWWFIFVNVEKITIPAPPEGVSVSSSTTSTLLASASEPNDLRIPSIGVLASFEPALGLSEDGSIGVPEGYDTVGWYKYGPTPGELGPAIIIGHVDSVDGPGVFFELGKVSVGDLVEIDRDDGSTAVFAITGYERVEQDAFPMERVYGNISHAGIRIITCSGTYNHVTKRYNRNLIVYGELVEVVTS